MTSEDLEECCGPASSRHLQFRDRVQKTFYYGHYSDRSLPSLAVTDVAVEVLSAVAPTKRKQLDASYAMAVSRRAKISPCTLMMGILYSERLRQKNPDYLKRVSSSDLFLISMMVASKYLYDEGEDEEVFNDDWAKAGNRTVNEVNKLEMEFLASIDWSLFISNEDFLDFVNKVESRVATTHGLGRGWFTYGDLGTLLDNVNFLKTLGIFRMEILKVFCACALAYIMSLSLALSLTALASRHHHLHLRTTNGLAAPCLPTESACHFHQKAVTEVPPTLQEGGFTNGSCKFCSSSRILAQGRNSLGERSLKQGVNRQFGEDQSRFTSEHFRSVLDPYSYRMPIIPNETALTVEIVPRLSEDKTHRVIPNLSCGHSHFLSNLSSLKVLLQSAKLSTSIAKNSNTNSKMTVAEGDSLFSEILQRRRNIFNHLSSNRSYVCVA